MRNKKNPFSTKLSFIQTSIHKIINKFFQWYICFPFVLFFQSLKIMCSQVFFQAEDVYNLNYKLQFDCYHSLFSADLSASMNILANQIAIHLSDVVCSPYLSSHFQFLFTHFKPQS